MIVDSSFIIDLMAAEAGAAAKLDELVHDAAPIAVSALTVTEVRRGLETAEQRSSFDDVIDDVAVVPFDGDEARTTVDLLRRLDGAGRPIGAVDAMIAATALDRGGKLLTRNLGEFERVDGLRVVPY